MSPFTFNPCQNENFFGGSHFGVSSCRHFVDSLSDERMGAAQTVDKVPSHKKRAVILRNEVTKNPVDQLNVELFKIAEC